MSDDNRQLEFDFDGDTPPACYNVGMAHNAPTLPPPSDMPAMWPSHQLQVERAKVEAAIAVLRTVRRASLGPGLCEDLDLALADLANVCKDMGR